MARRARRCGPVLAIIVLIATLGVAQAQQRWALLVGVSRYDNLPTGLQLRGPANDVALAAAVLREHGFQRERMRLLAEPPVGEARPTRAAIMGALGALAAQAGDGDFVYVHFSGHGSQQPARRASDGASNEPDALDEIFLPADVGAWDGAVGAVANAIVDDEIGEALAAIRAKGAFVWAVFDTCHSGTMTRGVAVDDVRLRMVAPAMLGIPTLTDGRGGATATAGAARRRDRREGASVAFYAAQSDERAPEMRLPPEARDRKPHGLFSFTTLGVIAASPGITYRQAAQRVLQSYGADYRWGLGPLFEGSGLDAPVFGTTAAPAIRQWPIRHGGAAIGIDAGALHRIGEGDEFLVLPGPTARIEEALGRARAAEVAAMTTTLQVTDRAGAALAPGAIPDRAYARLVGASFRAELRLAPPPLAGLPPSLAGSLRAILDRDALRAEAEDEGVRLVWAAPDGAADIRLLAEPGREGEPPRLWFLSPAGEIRREGPGRTHSVPIEDDREATRRAVVTSLVRIGNATNLLRLAGAVERPGAAVAAALAVAVQRAGSGASVAVAPQETPVLHGGDRLRLRLVNGGDRPLDMTLLAIDPDHGITPVFPAGPNENNRVEAHGEHVIDAEIDDATPGTERLILIAVAAEKGAERVDFSFLAQPRLVRLRGGGTDQGRRDIRALLAAAGLRAPATRGGATATGPAVEAVAIQVFTWSTRPKD